jgi:hypothetical protein
VAGYGTDNDFNAWLTASGYQLPDGSPTASALRSRASRWLDATFADMFTGRPADPVTQERAWPRIGATAFGQPIGESDIPLAVIHASFAAAYQEARKPGLLDAIEDQRGAVKRRKVDDLEIEYQDRKESDKLLAAEGLQAPALRLYVVEGLLAPLLKKSVTSLGSFIYSI